MKRKGKVRAKSKVLKGAADGDKREKSLLSRTPDWVIVLCFSVLFLTQTILSVREESATFDETVHLPAGYLYLKFGDYSYNAAHPPLVKMLAALPLLFVEVKLPPLEKPWVAYGPGIRFLYEDNDADRLLFLGRMAVLPMALLLGSGVFLWTRQLFGRGAAIFATLLYSFEPNILAHAPLVNTDIGAASFMFLTVYLFYRLIHRITVARLLLAGFSLGLALVTKFSTLPLLPILLLVGSSVIVTHHTIGVHFRGASPIPVAGGIQKLLILLVALVGMGLVAYVTLWGAFRFRYAGVVLPGLAYQGPWNDVLPGHPWVQWAIHWIREGKLLPEAYLYGFLGVSSAVGARFSYLMGELSYEGWWYYFIVTFVLKTPLPFLLLLLVIPVALRSLWRKDPVGVLSLLVPVLIYFGIASISRLSIGHRHILPIYPFLFVMAGSLVPWLKQQQALVKGGAVVLAAWYIVSSVAIFPHYLAYFNELAGGPRNGYKYLVDSNLDWGQDLKGLKRYMDSHGIERIWLSYFGTASPRYYGIAYNYLPGYLDHSRNAEVEPTPYVAISVTNLQGVYLSTHGLSQDYFSGFRQREPIARIGYSINLYRHD